MSPARSSAEAPDLSQARMDGTVYRKPAPHIAGMPERKSMEDASINALFAPELIQCVAAGSDLNVSTLSRSHAGYALKGRRIARDSAGTDFRLHIPLGSTHSALLMRCCRVVQDAEG